MDSELSPFLFFLKLLWKNKKFFIAFNLIVLISAVIIALILPKWYKADAKLYIEDDQQSSLSVSGMLEGLPFGLGGGQNEMILERNKAIMSSRSFMDPVIEKFDLENIYKTKFREETYNALQENLRFVDNEDGTFSIIGYYKEKPQVAADLVNYAASLLQRLNVELDKKSAAKSRQFLEESYLQKKKELFILEDSLKNYQIKTNIIQLEDQVKVVVEQVANLEAQKIQYEIELDYLKANFKKDFQETSKLQNQISSVQNKINLMKKSNIYSNLPLNQIPEEGMQYLRIYRDVMIGQKVLEVIIPQVEMAKIDEYKDISSMVIIDHAVKPEQKYKPKRTAIVIISTFISIMVSIIILYLSDFIRQNKTELKKILNAG